MTDFVLVCFDISDKKRLRRVSNELENFGTRVQRSVFECRLDAQNLNELKTRLQQLINDTQDHIRYYPLCGKDVPQVLIDGPGDTATDPDYHLL